MKDTLNQELLSTLATQVKALDQANAALQDAQRRLLTEREQERKYVARELHDQVIQDLLSTNYELETIEAHMQDTVELASIRHNIRGMVEDIRRICGNLRPPTIDSLGLSAAVQSFTNEWSRRTNIDISLRIEKLGRLPEATELSIFRIIQESLSNIKRHAAATQVEILIEHTSPRTLMVTIADNGEGMTTDEFDLSQLSSKGHYGLLGISERVALLSGHLRLQNRADGGLMIQVQVPHPRVEADIHFPTV
ncbi:MAG: histidine kinase [Phototrophicaceae bacterium]